MKLCFFATLRVNKPPSSPSTGSDGPLGGSVGVLPSWGKEPRETLVRALDLSAEQGFAVGFAVDIAAVDPPFSELRVIQPPAALDRLNWSNFRILKL